MSIINSVSLQTAEDILRMCDNQLPYILKHLLLNSSYSLSAAEVTHLKCDSCVLTDAQLDILYSDQTCIKSKYDNLFLLCFLFSLIFFFGLAGNWLVLWAVITGGRALSSVMHLFIVNLAVGDLLMVVLCVPATTVSVFVLHYWPFGAVLCVGFSYLQVRGLIHE
ncbi:hypothetical protein HAZT_HAZT011688 [Hyalella azteca]|uniref:G-protein coupled receptors family 1 profile domain-containing protein n=1 Tax=Hyalella azteca TaxID=294128 RepID=A0A6A0GRX3_HYAAZ|nr:hypothetical protein HAZT_HAZT011688 [Hyalella azteca]